MTLHEVQTDRIDSTAEVVFRTGLSVSTIDRMVKAGRFPEPLRLSPRRKGWLNSTVSSWLRGEWGPATASQPSAK